MVFIYYIAIFYNYLNLCLYERHIKYISPSASHTHTHSHANTYTQRGREDTFLQIVLLQLFAANLVPFLWEE